MNRRSFLGKIGYGVAGIFAFPRKAKAQEFPFMPTLEWLQEHNKEIQNCNTAYTNRGQVWDTIVSRKSNGRKNRQYWFAIFFWENGKWVAVDREFRHEDGRLDYFNKIAWPSWVRKF